MMRRRPVVVRRGPGLLGTAAHTAFAQRVSFSLVPGQHIVPDPVHHLALRPAGKVNVTVKRR